MICRKWITWCWTTWIQRTALIGIQPVVGWRATGRDGEIGAWDTTSKTDQVDKDSEGKAFFFFGIWKEKPRTFKWWWFLFSSRLLHGENPKDRFLLWSTKTWNQSRVDSKLQIDKTFHHKKLPSSKVTWQPCGNLKDPFMKSCVSWMIPNHYMGSSCLAKLSSETDSVSWEAAKGTCFVCCGT